MVIEQTILDEELLEKEREAQAELQKHLKDMFKKGGLTFKTDDGNTIKIKGKKAEGGSVSIKLETSKKEEKK